MFPLYSVLNSYNPSFIKGTNFADILILRFQQIKTVLDFMLFLVGKRIHKGFKITTVCPYFSFRAVKIY